MAATGAATGAVQQRATIAEQLGDGKVVRQKDVHQLAELLKPIQEPSREAKLIQAQPLLELSKHLRRLADDSAKPNFSERELPEWRKFYATAQKAFTSPAFLAYQETQGVEYDTSKLARKLDELNKRVEDMHSVSDSCALPLRSGSLKGGDGQPLRFASVYGLEFVKEQFRQLYILPSSYPKLFGGVSPKGLIMYGPPGTAKTTLATAAVNELPDTAYFAVSPGELKGKYEGETEKAIERVFRCAARAVHSSGGEFKRAVIFIDEFDSLAGRRDDSAEAAANTRTVNTLLQMMDGIMSDPLVSVIAATNRLSRIDPGVLRRFSAKILVDHPDLEARRGLIRAFVARHYAPPWLPRSKRTYAAALNAIASYGACNSQTTWVGTSKDEARRRKTGAFMFDDATVEQLVRWTGPNATAAVREELKGRRGNDAKSSEYASDAKSASAPEFSSEAKSDFGYSGSDINSMLEVLMRTVATRAVPTSEFRDAEDYEARTYRRIVRPAQAVPASGASAPGSAGKRSSQVFYVLVPDELCAAAVRRGRRRAADDDGRDAGDTEEYPDSEADADASRDGVLLSESKLSDADKDHIVTFDVRRSDIERALAQFGPPTTSSADYRDYVSRGKSDV